MSNILSTSTKNTSFEEVYNFMTYESNSTRMKSLNVSQFSRVRSDKSTVTALSFNGIRIISYPYLTTMAQKFIDSFPEEIEIKVKGYIDETGCGHIVTLLPETYQQFVKGRESIDLHSNGSIKVELKYTIIPSNEEGFLGNIKNKAYNSMTASMESFFLDLYHEKRKVCFNVDPVVKINTLQELKKEFTV